MIGFEKLEELRTRKEVEDYLKQLGKKITDAEIDALKQSYDQTQESSGTLTLAQLDDVAGGLKLVFKICTQAKTCEDHWSSKKFADKTNGLSFIDYHSGCIVDKKTGKRRTDYCGRLLYNVVGATFDDSKTISAEFRNELGKVTSTFNGTAKKFCVLYPEQAALVKKLYNATKTKEGTSRATLCGHPNDDAAFQSFFSEE